MAKKQKEDLRKPKVDKAHFKVRVAGEREKRLDLLIETQSIVARFSTDI